MSTLGSQENNRLAEGKKVAPRAYHVAIGFHPAIRLERKRGLEYAASLADYIDPSDISLEPRRWVFSQPTSGSTRSRLEVIVEPNQIQINAAFPTQAKEWFEDRQFTVFEKFGECFTPEIILHSAAMMRATLAIDGDARSFLANRVMKLSEAPLRSFGRPIHVIGMHFVFPPFQSETADGTKVTDWLVDVKVESLTEDPAQLFLEADARWQKPIAWTKENLEKIVARQDEVAAYLEENVARFLRQAANQEGGPG